MRKAATILLLIPFALIGTLVAGVIVASLVVITENPGRSMNNPAGVFAAGVFVGMQGAVPASLFTVPVSFLAFPLAYYLLPPRGHSALNSTLHCAGHGLGIAVLACAAIFAHSLYLGVSVVDQIIGGLAFLGSAGAITGALFGLAKHRLPSGPSARVLSATTVTLYWLVSASLLGGAIGMLVYAGAKYSLGKRAPAHLVQLWWARGQWAGTGVVVGSALVLAFVRRQVLGGTEVAIYWLGSALAVAWAMLVLFSVMGWRLPGIGGTDVSAMVAWAALAAGSAILLALARRRALSRVELAIYGPSVGQHAARSNP